MASRKRSLGRLGALGKGLSVLVVVFALNSSPAEEPGARIVIPDASKSLFELSDAMVGANMEDLHYQMTGGLYSQLIHGESFFEPTPTDIARDGQPFLGFTVRGGVWKLAGNELRVNLGGARATHLADVPAPAGLEAQGKGARLSSDAFAAAEIVETMVEIRFPIGATGAAGLAVHIQPCEADDKWEWFSGYTVELLAKEQQVVLKRAERASRHVEWKRVPCAVPADHWISLAIRIAGSHLAVKVDGRELLAVDDGQPLATGRRGVVASENVCFRNFSETADDNSRHAIHFTPHPLLVTPGDAISLRWAKVQTGSAQGGFAHEIAGGWFPGKPSQTITFTGGDGELGIDNAGLTRWGINIKPGKPYEGVLRIKSAAPAQVKVSLRSADGGKIYAAKSLALAGQGEYERLRFNLTPAAADPDGRFAITLTQPGSITVGFAFLEPGEWNRFAGLPVRKDLAAAVMGQGIRLLRMNGGMIERPDYRWKNMQGPRDERPPYDGFYDRWCGNGFGLIEFLQFCDAAHIVPVPALNLEETPEAVADFLSYATAPEGTPAGRRRARDGHAAPFKLPFYQVANESKFNQEYVDKFKLVAEAVWKVAPQITLITTSTRPRLKEDESPEQIRQKLARHLDLLNFARDHGHKRIMFDCHCHPEWVADAVAFGHWIKRLAPCPGDASVGVLEFNAGSFDFERGLAHAREMNATDRGGDGIRAAGMPNLSQPWKVYQTDWKAVLWTQGNIYYTQDKVWFQTAYYVDQMIARTWAPLALACETQAPTNTLDAFAAKTADGRRLVLRVVNAADGPIPASISLGGFVPTKPVATVEQLTGAPRDFNTLEQPEKIKPVRTNWEPEFKAGQATGRAVDKAAADASRRTWPGAAVGKIRLPTLAALPLRRSGSAATRPADSVTRREATFVFPAHSFTTMVME